VRAAVVVVGATTALYIAYRYGKRSGGMNSKRLPQDDDHSLPLRTKVAEEREARKEENKEVKEEENEANTKKLAATEEYDIPFHELDPAQKWVAIKDIVHGFVYLSAKERKAVDTPLYKALDDVQQLSTAKYLYPSVGYTRKEHSFGCAHLAWKVLKHIRSVQPEIGVTDFIMESVRMAALMHDVAHCLNSHTADNYILKRYKMAPWMYEHETRGAKLFEFIVKEENLDYSEEQVRLIQHLMTGDYLEGYPRWLFMIVACETTGFDYDKVRVCNIRTRASYQHASQTGFAYFVFLA
jgi:hypothetical protein